MRGKLSDIGGAALMRQTQQTTSRLEADLVRVKPAIARRTRAQGGHEPVGAFGRLVSIETDDLCPSRCTGRSKLAHRHKGIFINAQHLRILVSPVIRRAAELLATPVKMAAISRIFRWRPGSVRRAVRPSAPSYYATNREAFQRGPPRPAYRPPAKLRSQSTESLNRRAGARWCQ